MELKSMPCSNHWKVMTAAQSLQGKGDILTLRRLLLLEESHAMEKHFNYRDLETFTSLYDYLLRKWCVSHAKNKPFISSK